jgi:hypothetical protein
MIPILFYLGWLILAVAGIGSIVSCILEIKSHEPIYMALLKVLSFLTAIAGILIGAGGTL